MSIERGRLGKLEIGDPASEMDLITSLSFDPGINVEDITHLGSTAIEQMNVLANPTLTISGYVDASDTAQAALRTAAFSATTTITDVTYTAPDESTAYAFPDTAMVTAYSEDVDPKGFWTFSATIVANGAVTPA